MRKKVIIVGLCVVVLVGLCVVVFKGAQHLGAQRQMPATYTFEGTKYWSSEDSWLGFQYHMCVEPLSICGAPGSNSDNTQNMTLLATKGSKPSTMIYSIDGHDKNAVIGVIQYDEDWDTDYYGHQVYQNPTIYTSQPITNFGQAIEMLQPGVIVNGYMGYGFYYNQDDVSTLTSLLAQMGAVPATVLEPVNLTGNPVGPKLSPSSNDNQLTICDSSERVCNGGIFGLSYFVGTDHHTYVYYMNPKSTSNANLFMGWQVNQQLADLLIQPCPDCRVSPPT